MTDARYVYQHEGRKSLGKGPMLGIFGAGEWGAQQGPRHEEPMERCHGCRGPHAGEQLAVCKSYVPCHVDMDNLYMDAERQCNLPLLSQNHQMSLQQRQCSPLRNITLHTMNSR